MATSLLLTLPELILSIGALVLLMVAAYAGDGSTRTIGWLSVALLAAATLSLHVGGPLTASIARTILPPSPRC
jgi:NADH-quinone oxidoreductase subunit N